MVLCWQWFEHGNETGGGQDQLHWKQRRARVDHFRLLNGQTDRQTDRCCMGAYAAYNHRFFFKKKKKRLGAVKVRWQTPLLTWIVINWHPCNKNPLADDKLVEISLRSWSNLLLTPIWFMEDILRHALYKRWGRIKKVFYFTQHFGDIAAINFL